MPKTGIIYGESDSTKTTQLYNIARWLRDKWKREKKNKYIRYYAIDGGSKQNSPFHESGMVDEGFVQVLDNSESNIVLVESQAIAEGRWPDGEYVGSDTEWAEYDREYVRTNIGAYFIEGLASLCDRWKGHITKKPEKVGFASWDYTEIGEAGLRDFKMGGVDKGHYLMLQNELSIWWNKGVSNLPVEYIFCTSLVSEGKVKKGGSTIYGPASAGSAITNDIPSWFGDCWHLEDKEFTNKEGKTVNAKVGWFSNHKDPDTECNYLAKVRVLVDKIEARDKMFPHGFILLTKTGKGIEQFYKWRDGE